MDFVKYFVASANWESIAVNVDFVDIDLKTYNMCIDALSEKLIKADKEGKLPKFSAVHLLANHVTQAIYKLSKIYGFKIIEDASHAIGASYDKFKVGSCKHSDITVFSFHPVKIITTAEGGMTLTNNKKLADKIKYLRTSQIQIIKIFFINAQKKKFGIINKLI